MNKTQPANAILVRLMWLAAGLAALAALAYLAIAWGILAVGDLELARDGGVIVYVAAGCYLLGGLLILVRRRWLWILGVVINALVVLFYLRLYQARPAVLFSLGGLTTKAAQLLLEATLISLIGIEWWRTHRSERRPLQ